jgi:preprotein translocase subunit SecG
MAPIIFADFMHYFFGITMFLTALFLILLVLVQRGRGGGLSGAFGGMGGQSAFGTKAGDLFTRITMIAAAFWILLCMASIKVLSTKPVAPAVTTKPAVKAPSGTEAESAGEGSEDAPAATDSGPALGTGDSGTQAEAETSETPSGTTGTKADDSSPE